MCLKCTCEHYEHTSLTFLPKFHVTDPCLLFYLFSFPRLLFPTCVLDLLCGDVLKPLL